MKTIETIAKGDVYDGLRLRTYPVVNDAVIKAALRGCLKSFGRI